MAGPVLDLIEVPDRRKRVYVVSYPNSGRTWLRVMLSRYKQLLVGFEDFHVKLHAHYSESPSSPQYIFYHARSAEPISRGLWSRLRGDRPSYPLDLSPCDESRVVFLVRDPRDVLVSNYHEVAGRQKRFTGSLSSFVRDPLFGIERLTHFCNRIHEYYGERRDSCMFVAYEDLSVDPERVLRAILEFSDAAIVEDHLRDSIRFASFENMKALERENKLVRQLDGRARTESSVQKVRKGRIGGYRDELSADDIAFIDTKVQGELAAFFHGAPFAWTS